MTSRILAGYLNEEDLCIVVRASSQPGVFFILESLVDLQMGRIETSESFWPDADPSAHEEGRLFDDCFELRWQRLRGYPPHSHPFRVRFIIDEADVPADIANVPWQSQASTDATSQELCCIGEDNLYLWGEVIEGQGNYNSPQLGWYEKEIPHIFYYPLATDSKSWRVKIKIKNYTMTQASSLDFTPDDCPLYRFAAFLNTKEQ